MGKVEAAYEAHERHKNLVRYEDRRADTLGKMEQIHRALIVNETTAPLLREYSGSEASLRVTE